MMPLDRWLARELAPDIAHALGPHGPRAPRPHAAGRDRAPPGRARVGPEESCDAPLGALDPRALVRALRAGLRPRDEAARHRPHRELLRLGRPGDPHPDRGARLPGSRPPRDAGRAGRGADRRGGRAARTAGRPPRHPGEAAAGISSRCGASSPRSAREIDVVNTHSSTDSWLTALACATLARAPPIVRTRHVSTTIRNRPTTRWLYTRATAHIVTTGEALRRQLARDNGVPLDHMTSVPTGIDLARFVPGDADRARARASACRRDRRSASSRRCATGRAMTCCSTRSRATAPRGTAGTSSSSATAPTAIASTRSSRALGLVDAHPLRRTAGRRRAMAAGARSLRAALMGRGGRAAGDPAGDGLRSSGRLDHGRRDHRGRRPMATTGLIVPPRDVACARRRARAAARRRRRCGRASAARVVRARMRGFRHRADARLDGSRVSRRDRRGALTMCGIAGYFGRRVSSPASVERMMAALRQRGPDAEHMRFWDAALRRRRPRAERAPAHAAVDHRPAAGGRPADGQRRGRRLDRLQRRGLRLGRGRARRCRRPATCFRTRSDTEFILHAYEHWGIDCVARLRGMFAFAILDLRRRALYVVRDRLGLKPVVYAHRDDGFAFASTTRALLPWLPREARGFSAEGIDAYLAHRTIPAPRTIFRRSRGCPRALAALRPRDRSVETREYWRPEPSAEPWLATLRRGNPDAHGRRPAARALPLVGRRLARDRLPARGDGLQLGCRASPRRSRARRSTSRDSRAPRRTGWAFPNLAVTIPTGIAADFERLVADLDEPFADPSCVPTWYLARETTRHVKVVLGGDGGDELFGGYKRYAKHLRTRWRRGLVRAAVCARPPAIGGSGWQRAIEELRLDWRAAYALRFSGFTPGERAFLAPEAAPPAHYWRMPAADGADLPALLEIDRLNYLPDYILRKADLCTMAHGLEMRAPFLDHRFVGAVMALPHADALHDASAPAARAGDGARSAISIPSRARSAGSIRRSPDGSRAISRRGCPGIGARLGALSHGMLSASRDRRVRRRVARRRRSASPSRCCSSCCSTPRSRQLAALCGAAARLTASVIMTGGGSRTACGGVDPEVLLRPRRRCPIPPSAYHRRGMSVALAFACLFVATPAVPPSALVPLGRARSRRARDVRLRRLARADRAAAQGRMVGVDHRRRRLGRLRA